MGCSISRGVVPLDSNENKSVPPARSVPIRVRELPAKKVSKAKEKPLVLRNVSSSDGSSFKNDASSSEADSRSCGEEDDLRMAPRSNKGSKPDGLALTPQTRTGPGPGNADEQTEVTALEDNYEVKAGSGRPASKVKADARCNGEDKAESKGDMEGNLPSKTDRDLERDSNEKETTLQNSDDIADDVTLEVEPQTEVHREAWGEAKGAVPAGKETEAIEAKNKEDTGDDKTQQNLMNKPLMKPKVFPRRTQAEQKEILQQLREEGILSSVTGVRQGGVAFFVPSQSEAPEAQARPPRVLERLKPYKSHRRGHYTLEEKLLIAEILRDEKLKQHGAMARRFEQRRRKLLQDKNDKTSQGGEEDYEAIPGEAVEGVESRMSAREDWSSRRTSDEEAACDNPSACPDS